MQGASIFHPSIRRYSRVFAGLSASAAIALAPAADAALKVEFSNPKLNQNEPVLMDAEEMFYDRANALVTAKGSVEVTQGDYILLADRITYDQQSDVVKASGHVSVLEPTGNVYFADEITLQNNMQAGVIDNFRARLSDNSTFAAREARKIDDDVTELKNAVYSPCKTCRDAQGRGKAPLWQIKAKDVRIDTQAQEVVYHDAFFEVYGVPVIYSPYLKHATPGADNKSGFLSPEFSQSSNLGSVFRIPYFYSIAPDKDLTLTPILTSEEGPVLFAQYRQLFDNGALAVEGSVTRPARRDALGNETSGDETRGHIRARGDFMQNEVWGWGFDLNRATDDTYLRRYNFSYEDMLTSRIYAERIRDRNYTVFEGLAFQGLTISDDPDRSPVVFPYAETHYETEPGWRGSRFLVDANARVLNRQLGADSRSISATGAWQIPYVTPGGHIFEAKTSLRSDVYSVNDVVAGPTDPDFDGTTGRVIPQAQLDWRYPLVKRFGERSLIVEPIANVIASGKGGNPLKIPNEDAQSLDFTDANLFTANRFPGSDRVETGSRVNYGLRTQYQWANAKDLHFVFGQSYRTSDNGFPYTNGFDDDFSDYVGRVGYNADPFQLFYRFRLDKDNLTFSRNEVDLAYAQYPLSFSLNYISLDDDPLFGEKQEVFGAAGVNLNSNWTLTLNGRRDLKDSGWVSTGVGVIFQNECVTVLTGLNRNYTRDRDIEPDTSFTVRLLLKNLE